METNSPKEVQDLSYDTAMAEAEALLRQLESEKMPIDEVLKKSRQVTALIKHCREKIKEVGMEVDEILEELKNVAANEDGI